MHSAVTVPLFLTVSYFISRFTIRQARRWQKLRKIRKEYDCQPPAVQLPWDPLGIVMICISIYHLLHNTAIPNMVSLFSRYGETYKATVFLQPLVFTCDPANIKQILVNRFQDYNTAEGIRAHMFKPFTPYGIFALDGEDWKRVRSLYRNLFSRTRAIFDCGVHEAVFQDFVRCVPQNGLEFDLQPLLPKLLVDSATQWIMGECNGCLLDQQTSRGKKLVEGIMYAKHVISRDGRLGPMSMFTSRKRYHQACNNVKAEIGDVVTKALERHAKCKKNGVTLVACEEAAGHKPTLIHRMLEHTTDPVLLRDTITSILLGATDSVTSMLASTFWLLARHEHDYRKLRSAVLEVCGTEPPRFDQLRQIKYLRWVHNEAMRLFPPIPLNAKMANEDTWLPTGGGKDGTHAVLIKKGDIVTFSSWNTHRRATTFGDDVDNFRPDRWADLSSDTQGYIPFNIGPRACPGQHFAYAQAAYFTSRIVQVYPTLSTSDARPWVEKLELNMINNNGVLVSFAA